MAMKLYPTQVEIFDSDLGQLMATISTCDVCAEVKIETVVTVEAWDEMSGLVRTAIEMVTAGT